MKAKLLMVHGGGPTPVINASLYGVINRAKKSLEIEGVYGALFGTKGFLEGSFIRLDTLTEEELNRLLSTPGTAIGTSRTPLEQAEYETMATMAKAHGFKYIIFNGGNGTMDTCGKLSRVAGEAMQVVGIPKTIDNDLASIDHSPGYGSAARYVAGTVGEIIQDVKGMPIHVSIIETMGRNTGWIAAASSLGAEFGYQPDLIYFPERPFNEEAFLEDVLEIHKRKGGVVVVASEGLVNSEGEPITQPIFTSGRATYFGDVGTYLAELVIKKLGIKSRSEKPGIAGRASTMWASDIDRDEAVMLGEYAVELLLDGQSDVMVGLDRVAGSDYAVMKKVVPLKEVMMVEKTLDEQFINERGNYVTEAFIRYARPLIGSDLPRYADLIKEG